MHLTLCRRPASVLGAGLYFLLACLVLTSACWSEEAPTAKPVPGIPAESKSPEPTPTSSPTATKAADNKPISGRVYLDASYLYNFNAPYEVNDFHVFDNRANALTLQAFQYLVQKETTETHPVGFLLDVVAGQTARYVHAYGLGSINNPVDVTEGFLRYKTPVGKGLDIEVGKFLSPCGAESTFAIDDINYSRSFLYNYAVPFTHTGLRAHYDFSDKISLTGYAVQGWDDFNDNNTAKTFGFSLGYNPLDEANFTLNVFTGPEQAHNDSNNRVLLDWVGTFKPAKNWLMMLNFDYGQEQNVAGIGNARWSGVAGYVRREINDWFSLALRGEVFNDTNGARTFANALPGTLTAPIPQTLSEVTFSPEFKLPGNIILRPEYRHDWSTASSFANGTKRSQDILGIGLLWQHPFSF